MAVAHRGGPYASQDREPNLAEAAERVREATRELVEHRVRLAMLEAREMGERAARSGALFGAAGVLALLTWMGLLALGVVLLDRVWPLWAALAVVMGANGLLAFGCALAGRRQLRGASPGDETS